MQNNARPSFFLIIASASYAHQHTLPHITKQLPCRGSGRHPVQGGSLPSACLVVTLSRVGGAAGEEELSSAAGPRETGTRLDYSEDAFHRQTVCFEWQCSTNTPRGTTRYTSNSCGWRRGSWAGAGASLPRFSLCEGHRGPLMITLGHNTDYSIVRDTQGKICLRNVGI